MISDVLGIDKFLKGLRSYLKKYQFSNAATDDLWNSLSQVNDANINVFMSCNYIIIVEFC